MENLNVDGAIRALTGSVTSDGWTIGELVQKASYQTGGNFSVGYLVEHIDGRRGFLKALDFSRAMVAADPVRALESMTSSYNFERDVLALCRGARLSKIVSAISSGSVDAPDAPLGKVFYLIFELANGDVRQRAVLSTAFDLTWTLRAIHHICTGVSQLHYRDIFHQDLKPSNILVFGPDEESKLADLGRAYCKSIGSPHDTLIIAGVRHYAPPEQAYNFALEDSNMMRAAADMYLLGSIVYFFFMGTMLTPSLLDKLRKEHMPRMFARDDGGWAGTFDDILPYLRNAFAQITLELKFHVDQKFLDAGVPEDAEELLSLFQYLTDPDPRRRGHPGERRMKYSNPYELRRFISAFNRISLRSERRALS